MRLTGEMKQTTPDRRAAKDITEQGLEHTIQVNGGRATGHYKQCASMSRSEICVGEKEHAMGEKYNHAQTYHGKMKQT